MKVGELIEKLQKFDKDIETEIAMTYDCGCGKCSSEIHDIEYSNGILSLSGVE